MHKITVQYATPQDAAGFEERYREEHIPLVHGLPGLERFTLSKPRALSGDAPFLVAELWFPDADTLRTALKSEQMAAAGRHAAGLGVPMSMHAGEVEEIPLP